MNKWIRIPLVILFVLGLITGGLALYLYVVAIVQPPNPTDLSSLNRPLTRLSSTCTTSGNNWIRKSSSGLWEMYVEGDAFERGVMNGRLSRDLVHEQEDAFAEQINKLVPSKFYRNFLKYFIAWFNRNLDQSIPDENKMEIFGVSRSASSEFDYVGTAYQRMMNYHAAHDIGHAMQNLALVGCSSFATWGDKSEDGRLLVGRNFDFYAGDRFAENKIVLFVRPDKGIPFMMITWGGFTGVVSGMNEAGLTVTLNAAKSEIPTGSATPVSIIAREILQYASNLEEAAQIASKQRSFVSESFLIGSAKDNRAVSFEITPDTFAIYDPGINQIINTNHFMSARLGKTKLNLDHKINSASGYRYNRIKQLLDSLPKNTPIATAAILRNQLGIDNKFIGYGNERSINQLICHHSIIFDPQNRTAWISTAPWQLGKYVVYHLDSIFAMKGLSSDHELIDTLLTIPADTFLNTQDYRNFVEFRKLREKLKDDVDGDPQKLVSLNPDYYDAYAVAGDYCFGKKQFAEAIPFYEKGLTMVVASKAERQHMEDRLKISKEKSR